MTDLCHYTISTGDIRRSPRAEVGDDVIAALASTLATGWHQVPGFPSHRVRVTIDGAVLLATVHVARRFEHPLSWPDDIPLVTFGVAVDQAGLAALRELLHVQPGADVWAPACLVRIEPFVVLGAPRSLEWIGDYERCVAWAWIEHHKTT